MTIDEIHLALQRERPVLRPNARKDGYSYFVGAKRVIRISPRDTSGGVYDLVRAASERAGRPDARCHFAGTLTDLLAIVDGEISLVCNEIKQR